MADDIENSLGRATWSGGTRPGEMPDHVRFYYRPELQPEWVDYLDRFDSSVAFRDHGTRLTLQVYDPDTVRDAVDTARHRRWEAVDLSGSESFRRGAWLAAMAVGLEARGYTPNLRDLDDLNEQIEAGRYPRRGPEPLSANESAQRLWAENGPRLILAAVEAVVQARIPEASAQAGILTRARERLSSLLGREVGSDGRRDRAPENTRQERQR